MRHAVFLVAVGDVVGGVLNVFRCVGHSDAESREAYHALVVVAVTAGDDLLATDAGQLKEPLQRVRLVDAGRHALQEETGRAVDIHHAFERFGQLQLKLVQRCRVADDQTFVADG